VIQTIGGEQIGISGQLLQVNNARQNVQSSLIGNSSNSDPIQGQLAVSEG